MSIASHKKRKKKLPESAISEESEVHTFVAKPLDDGVIATDPIEHRSDIHKEEPKVESRKKKVFVKKAVSSRKETEDESINKKLVEIYENNDGTMPDMKTFERKKRGRMVRAFVVFVVSVLLLGSVAWAGFFVFQPRSSFSEEDVVLTVSGPETIEAGKEVTYRVRYKNDQGVGLRDAMLEIRYPAGFIFTTSSIPTNNEQHTMWNLQTLDPHESGYIDIVGVLNGTVGERQSFRLFLNYRPNNFNSEFQKVAQATVLVDTSPVNLSVVGPQSIPTGGVGEIRIEVSPVDGYVTTGTLIVDLVPADIFTKKSSNPASDDLNPYRWTLNSFVSTTVLTVNGSFVKPVENTTSTILVRVLKPSGQGPNTSEYVLSSKQIDITFLETNLTASVAVNGSMGDVQAKPGEVLNTSIVIKNTGQSTLEHAVARMVWETPSYGNRSMLEWTQYESEPDADIAGEQITPERRKGTVMWDKRYIPDLERINPNDELFIDFTIPIRDASHAALSNFKDSNITGIFELQYDENGEHKIMRSNPINVIVISDLALDVQDSMTSENGTERHEITWLVSNSFHDLKDVKLEVEIYGDVQVPKDDMVVPAGTLTYDEAAKKLVWVISDMPTSLDVLALRFDILLKSKNPSQKNLTSKVKVTAQDTAVNQTITVRGDEILLK